jgi:hypothetical protein
VEKLRTIVRCNLTPTSLAAISMSRKNAFDFPQGLAVVSLPAFASVYSTRMYASLTSEGQLRRIIESRCGGVSSNRNSPNATSATVVRVSARPGARLVHTRNTADEPLDTDDGGGFPMDILRIPKPSD